MTWTIPLMTQATTPLTTHIPKTVSIRLRRLRTKILTWFLVDGVSRLLLCAVLMIVLDLLVDWLFHMDRAQRTVVLALAIGVLGMVLYRRVIRPLSCRLTDDSLCLEIEDRNEQLGQSLISAVQFARLDDFESRGVSPVLVRATIDQGVQQAVNVTFERILRADRLIANLVLLIITLVALSGVAVASVVNDSMATWFDRNVLLGGRQWPQDVHLVVEGVEDGRLTIPRGDDWPLSVTVGEDSRRLPKTVHIDFRGTVDQRSEPMLQSGDRRFQTVWRNVVEAFEFRARSGRASTPWIEVELVDRPVVEQLHLAATSPGYAGGQTETLPPGTGPYCVLKGSTLVARGTANKPVSKATLVAGGVRHQMRITDGQGFRTTLAPGEFSAGTYRVELTDTERLMLPGASEPGPLDSKRPTSFTLKIKLDREPQVLAKLIGVGTLVVPGARIPFECRIHDDFAVTAARLHHQWQGDNDDTSNDGVDRLDEFDGLRNRRTAWFQSTLELPPLAIPTGSRLSLFIEADDNDDVSGPKSGRSTTFMLRVVREDELRADLLRREKDLRLQLEEYVKQQEDVSVESEATLASVRDKAKLESVQRQLLMKLQKRQTLLGANLRTLAGRFEEIMAEVQNNRLEEDKGPLQRRLRDGVVDPLWKLTDDSVPQAGRHIDEAWRFSGDATKRNRALSNAIAAQRSILDAMRKVLAHLVKIEGFHEAVWRLHQIQEAQRDVMDVTNTAKQERIRGILNEGGNAEGEGR